MSKAKVEQKLTTLLTVFTIIVLFWGQIGQSYLALGGAKLRKSSKVEFIGANSDFGGANSDFGGVEMVPVPPVLAQIVQNEPRWAKLALKKLGPIWLLGSIWLFSFYSVDHFTRENVKDDTLFEEVSKKDCSTPDSEKKYVFF